MADGKEKLDDFTARIDEAIDTLFTPKRKVVIDPLTSEVQDAGETADQADQTPAATFSEEGYARPSGDPTPPADEPSADTAAPTPAATASPAPKKAAAPGSNPEITAVLRELEQHFLSIDWEVSAQTIGDFRRSLATLGSLLPAGDGNAVPVISAMDAVLAAMADNPARLPAGAVKSLQHGIVFLKQYTTGGDREKLTAAAAHLRRELESQLTAAAPDPAPEAPDALPEIGDDLISAEAIPDIPECRVPLETSNAVNLHLAILAQCVNRLLPLEKLFGANPRYEKFLADHQQVRLLLEEEKDNLATALNADFSAAALRPGTGIPEEFCRAVEQHLEVLSTCLATIKPIEQLAHRKRARKLYKVEHEIRRQLENQQALLERAIGRGRHARKIDISQVSSDLRRVFETHVEGLGKLVKQIQPIENLFGKTKGYEKLHAIQKRIRVQVEVQRRQLAEALVTHQIPEKTAPPAGSGGPAPFDTIMRGRWQGQMVAFLPTEVALCAPKTSIRKLLGPAGAALALKRMKRWPWSKLKPLFEGAMGRLPEERLQGLEIPRLNPIKPFSAIDPTDGTLLILFHDGAAAYAVLDDDPETVSTDGWQWVPLWAADTASLLLRGHLRREEEILPVLSLARIPS